MTQPGNCGATGGAISLWIKVHLEDVVTSLTTGVITSMDEVSSDEVSTGFKSAAGNMDVCKFTQSQIFLFDFPKLMLTQTN